mgnify:FL=1
MANLRSVLVLLLFWPVVAGAGPFDGVWDGSPGACVQPLSDMRATISGDEIRFYESTCRLSNPTAIRGMTDAVLYDAACSGEGQTWSNRILLARTGPEGEELAILSEGYLTQRQLCPATSGRPLLPYGSRAGMNVEIVALSSVDTARARVQVEHTAANARAFCVEYLLDQSETCVETHLNEMRTRLRGFATANCPQGTFETLFGQQMRLLGPAMPGAPQFLDWLILDVRNNAILDGSSASGYSEALAVFSTLCPSFLR